MTISSFLRALACVLACLSASTRSGFAQGMDSDPFASQVTGEWIGRGVYDGNELSLTRSWTIELSGQFLRAGMAVSMPNDASFGGLTYWKVLEVGTYEVVWLDGMGRMQTLHAVRNPESGLVSADFVDELAVDGPESRRWEFESRGQNSYAERLFRRRGDGWELLTEWTFERVAGDYERTTCESMGGH